jgi:hypothetical protein
MTHEELHSMKRLGTNRDGNGVYFGSLASGLTGLFVDSGDTEDLLVVGSGNITLTDFNTVVRASKYLETMTPEEKLQILHSKRE